MNNTVLSSRACANSRSRQRPHRQGTLRCTIAVIFALILSVSGPISTSGVALARNEAVTADVTGVVIDLGPSGDAVFQHDGHAVREAENYTLETFVIQYGTTMVVLDVMNGIVDIDAYMAVAEADIAAAYDYMDWLGGEWGPTHSWDIYSGAYKLDYRELVYLDLVHDPDSDIYLGIGVYGDQESLSHDIAWLQENISIDNQAILVEADIDMITAVITGTSGYLAEPFPMQLSSVEDWADVGLVSETSWHSPFTDTTLGWDGEVWVFPFAQDDAIRAEQGATSLELRTTDRRGELKIFTAESNQTPAEWIESLTADYSQSATFIDSRITEETAGVVLMHYTDFGHPVVMIADVYITDHGVAVITQLSAAPEDIADVYTSFWDSVQANGDFYPVTWTIEDIETLEFNGFVSRPGETNP